MYSHVVCYYNIFLHISGLEYTSYWITALAVYCIMLLYKSWVFFLTLLVHYCRNFVCFLLGHDGFMQPSQHSRGRETET